MSEGEGEGEVADPATNPHLFGHEAAERAFLRAWQSGRMPHAWLVTGPRGVGKATFAHRAARFVLSGGGSGGGLFGDAPEDLAVDMEAPAVRRMLAGGHADFRLVTRSPNEQGRLRQEIVVGDVRELGQFLRLTPAEGGWRVAVVDPADDLNRNAANALLKVLEEPPRQSLLILTSHSPGRLLPTIRSRCRRLALSPLPAAAVIDALRQLRPEAGGEASALAALADGSIGRAVMLADLDGLAIHRGLIALFERWPRLDLQEIAAWTDKVTRDRDGEGYAIATDLLLGWLARIAATGSGRGGALPEERETVARLLAGGRTDRWVGLWEKTSDLFARADGLDLERRHVLLTALTALDGPPA